MRRFTATNTGIWPRRGAKSAPSSTRSTTKNGFIPLSATCPLRSSRPTSPHKKGGRYTAAFCMSFLRHREIYRSDLIRLVRERRKRRPRPHRLDEFPVGYSSADCSPAGSASASPTADHSALKSSCRSILFHRTANSVLTVCLSQGDHPILFFCLFLWGQGPL